MAAARSKSADEASPAEGGGASALVGGRGPTTPLRMLKRTVVLETVSKSVTERKESTKQVTDQATGVERRRDSHIETSTTEEVRSKRQEETVESYDSAPLAAASQPILAAQGPPASVLVPEGADSTRKNTSPKHPVAIRVHDDDEETLTVKTPEPPVAPTAVPSILRTSSHEDVEHKSPHPHKLEFQEEEEYHRAELVKPPADLALRVAANADNKDEDDDEPAEPPPPRFNMRRKDSIAVAKLRMLRQQEEGASANSEEEADEDLSDTQTGSPDKKHASFRPPTVISIVNEHPDEDSADAPDPGEPKEDAHPTFAPPVEPPLNPDPGETVIESRTQVDSQVTSTEKEQVHTYANEIVTTKDTDEVVKKTLSEVTNEAAQQPSGDIVPREDSAAAIVATVVDDVSANVKTPMDNRSKQSL